MGRTVDSAKRFERPGIIRVGGSDRIVVDVNGAADILLRSFPRETERRKAAMVACLAVFRGKAHSLRARRELVSAALEVSILAGD